MRPPTTAVARLAVVPLLLFAAGCSVNPATGERQLTLFGERQEIEMGREADRQVVASLGLYRDSRLEPYVADLGRRLASLSERPDLPWSFRIVDDPVVNVFALPGGYVYVTRGILAYFTSEAELAAVLGHEIGHVTARHSVEQASRAQLAQLGLGLSAALAPEIRDYAGLAAQGLGLLFLKFSRDDERQADDLGLRYLERAGYDPRQMVEVFRMLDRVSATQPAGRVPGWLSTHPTPENRVQRITAEIRAEGSGRTAGTVGRGPYLDRVDGLVFGDDPRQGYFRGRLFVHPRLAFEIRFPEGWKTANQRHQVSAVAPGEDAVVVLSLASEPTPGQAATAFLAGQGVDDGGEWRVRFAGLEGEGRAFTVDRGEGREALSGLAAFVAVGGQVYRILGTALGSRFAGVRETLAASVESFRQVSDRSLLDVQPRRIDVVTLPSPTTLAALAKEDRGGVDLQSLSILNQVGAQTRLAAGTRVKRVVDGEGR